VALATEMQVVRGLQSEAGTGQKCETPSEK
jgi:hypothetical protein